MAGYGWDEYDARTGGRQTIHDAENNIDITTQFAKVPGGQHGGGWGVRINGALRPGAHPEMSTTAVFYVGNEGLGTLQVQNEYDELGYEGNVEILGTSQGLGGFKFEVTKGPSLNRHPVVQHHAAFGRPLDRTMVKSVQIPPGNLWQSKQIFFQELVKELDAYKQQYGEDNMPAPPLSFTIGTGDQQAANFHLIQKTFSGPFQFDVLFSSASAGEPMTSQRLSEAIEQSSKQFNGLYPKRFTAQAPFTDDKYDGFSKSMFSNLLGGIGYFYGDQLVDQSGAPEYDEENEGFWEEAAEAKARSKPELQGPYELFTSIPSRPFFPRGFLWDEGFHLIPVLDWDISLT